MVSQLIQRFNISSYQQLFCVSEDVRRYSNSLSVTWLSFHYLVGGIPFIIHVEWNSIYSLKEMINRILDWLRFHFFLCPAHAHASLSEAFTFSFITSLSIDVTISKHLLQPLHKQQQTFILPQTNHPMLYIVTFLSRNK